MTHVHELGAVTVTDLVAYAGASGDLNKLHHDEAFARSSGYDGPISMGMLHGAWALSSAARELALDLGAPWEVSLRFSDVVYPGEPLTARIDESPERVVVTLLAGVRAAVHVTLDPRPDPYVSPRPEGAVQIREARVELGSVRRFAGAVRWPLPVADDGTAPFSYPTALSQWLDTPDPVERVEFERLRTLHGTCRLHYPGGLLRVGEHVTVRAFVTDTRQRSGSAGPMTLRDVVEEAYVGDRLRSVQVNTLIETAPAPESAQPVAGVPRLPGSRDEQTGQTFFPPRTFGVDGSLRPTVPAELGTRGVLWAWTTYEGQAYGQVDLPGQVRVQTRLASADHVIGGTYELCGDAEGDWWFARA